ncbi:MAG: hypothetical protein U0V56_06315 [Actinomycetota bacterium]
MTLAHLDRDAAGGGHVHPEPRGSSGDERELRGVTIWPRAAEPLPNARAIRTFIPKLATTKTARPTTFCAVPDRIVR